MGFVLKWNYIINLLTTFYKGDVMLVKTLFLMALSSILLFANTADVYEKKCGVCHGKDGTTLAMGKSQVIKGLDVELIIKDLNDYASGKRKALPVVKLMKKSFLNSTSKEEVKDLAIFINKL